MNPFRYLAHQWAHARAVRRSASRLAQLNADFARAPNEASRAVVAMQIADRLEDVAEHLEASWLARWQVRFPDPGQWRAQARIWSIRSEAAWVLAATLDG